MFLIGLDEEQALDFISQVTRHLPIGASLGRIRLVASNGIVTDSAADGAVTFSLGDDGAYAWRSIDLRDGLTERTLWRDGRETGRYVHRADD